MPVFGLPGNPVSSMVSFELLAKPALRAMAGHSKSDLGPISARATSKVTLSHPSDGKTHYLRVFTERDKQNNLHITQSGEQGSHQLTMMARANGLAIVPEGAVFKFGDAVDVIPLAV